MTFLTFSTTHHFNSYTIDLLILNILMKLFENAVIVVVSELHFSSTVTVDAPSHREFGELVHFVHFSNGAVTGLALLLAGNYVLGASPTTASILRRVLTVSGVTVNGKVYDGNTAATLAGAGGFDGRVISGDDVQLDLAAALAAFADANAGNGKTVHVSGLGLSGADADNYVLASNAVDATADIARRALTVAVVGNPTKTFDGSTDVSLDASNFRLDGVVTGRDAIFTALPPANLIPAGGGFGGGGRGGGGAGGQGTVNASFYTWNLVRRYGSDDTWRQKWAQFTARRMADWGLNTLYGNDQTLVAAQPRQPYVVTIREWQGGQSFLGLPDVYAADFESRVDGIAERACKPYKDDPYLLGYFIGPNAPVHLPGIAFLIGSVLFVCGLVIASRRSLIASVREVMVRTAQAPAE